MNEIMQVIFGEYTNIELFGFAWFLLIGYTASALTETTGRDYKSRNTPRKWKWKFWYQDNWRRYLITILSTYMLFMFYENFTGNPFNNFEALMIGLIGDGIGNTAKKRVALVKADRKKIMSTMDGMDKDDDIDDDYNIDNEEERG